MAGNLVKVILYVFKSEMFSALSATFSLGWAVVCLCSFSLFCRLFGFGEFNKQISTATCTMAVQECALFTLCSFLCRS